MIKSALQSSLTNDVKYSSMSAGTVPSSEYLIATSLINNDSTAFIDFDVSAYAGVYRHLKFVTVTRGTTSGVAADEVKILFNNTSSTYYHHKLTGNGSTVGSFSYANERTISQNPRTSSGSLFYIASETDILDPFNPSKNTTVRSLFGGAGSNHLTISLSSTAWFSTAIVTTIRIEAEQNYFGSGTRLSLYGVTA